MSFEGNYHEALQRIVSLETDLARMIKARDLSAQASATLRDESIAKSERISKLEAERCTCGLLRSMK